MARPTKLSDDQVQSELKSLAGWTLAAGKLHRSFKFADFIAAWGFMSKVALIAQSMDHHPEWSNVYDTVSVDLSTHDAGGITKLDFELAHKIDSNA